MQLLESDALPLEPAGDADQAFQGQPSRSRGTTTKGAVYVVRTARDDQADAVTAYA